MFKVVEVRGARQPVGKNNRREGIEREEEDDWNLGYEKGAKEVEEIDKRGANLFSAARPGGFQITESKKSDAQFEFCGRAAETV